MAGLTSALASLQDVLEVKGSAISEPGLWSILCLSTEALQDILFTDNRADWDHLSKVLVTPDTVYMGPDGKVRLDTQPLQSFLSSDFCAPEWRLQTSHDKSSLEKFWIYSLGMTLYKAADYNKNRDEELDISPSLHSVLSDMCERNADLRLTLTQVMQFSSSHAANRMTESFGVHIVRMYELVFGSADNISGDNTFPSSIQSFPQTPIIHDDELVDGVRPAFTGESVVNEAASGRLSISQFHPASAHSTYSYPKHSATPHTFDLAHTVQDSIKLNKLKMNKAQHKYSVNGQTGYSHPMFSLNEIRLMHEPRLSLPTDNNFYSQPTSPVNSYNTGPLLRDSYLQHAYDKLSQRRALLSAIRRSLSSDNMGDHSVHLDQYQRSTGDLLASTHSINHGTFYPAQYNQENFLPRERIRPHSAYQLQPPDIMHHLERPNSAHPIFSCGEHDETDAVLKDAEVKRALLTSTHQDASHRTLFADITKSNTPVVPPNTRQHRPKTSSKVAADKKPIKQQANGGPEFVRVASQPIKKLKDILPLKNQNKGPAVTVLIEMLTGERLQLSCPTSTTGRQLFDVLLREANLPENYFFGLSYITGGEHVFLQSDKSIEKYVPGLKKKTFSAKKSPRNMLFSVHQRVKFYIKALSQLRHKHTQHLLYLQLRRDIIEDRLRGEDKEMLSLTGLALQAEYGDYDVTKHHLNYFVLSCYFPARILKRMNKMRQVIVNKHAANAGLSAVAAEARFIEEAMELHEYGIHFYSVYKIKDDPLSQAWVGITSRGLALAEKRSKNRFIVQRCSWDNIAKLSFNKEKFTIKPYSHSDDPIKIQRYTESYRKSKYLIWLSEEHHAFLMQSMLSGDFTHPYHQIAATTNSYEEGEEAEVDEFEEDELSEEVYEPDIYDVEPPSKSMRIATKDLGEVSSYQFQHGDPPVPVSAANLQAIPSSSKRREIDVPVLEPPGYGVSPPDVEETLSESLEARLDELSADSPEKRFVVVKLHRDSTSGIGIKLAGSSSGGVFIASLLAGGSAEQDGTLQIGDRVVAINGISTEVIDLNHAKEQIKKANDYVELIVSQAVSSSSLSSQDVVTKHAHGSEVPRHHNSACSLSSSSISEFDSNEIETAARIRDETMQSPEDLKHANTSPPEPEKTREALKAELEAEVAALKAEPQDSIDMSLHYQQQLAKYHPKHRAQGQSSIQLPLPSELPDSPSPGTLPSVHSNWREEMSSQDASAALSMPPITNIDHISSDEVEGEDDVSIQQQKLPQTTRAFRQTSIGSIVSSDVDSSIISEPNRRLSAFAAVSKNMQSQQTVRLGTSSSGSSTISEHTSTFKEQAANQQEGERKLVNNDYEEANNLSSESDESSEDKEVSEMLTGQKHTEELSSSSSSLDSSSSENEDLINSANNTWKLNSRLNTPVQDDFSTGDNYSLVLHKINQSLGLNVTGGTNTSVKHGAIYVKSLVPNGAAANSARIRIGDRVISVNSITLTSVTHKQAVEALRNASTPVTLVMERGELSVSSPLPGASSSAGQKVEDAEETLDTNSMQESRVVANRTPDLEKLSIIAQSPRLEVTLTKGSSGLGFSVLGGKDPSSPDPRLSLVRVKKIFPLGAAAQSKKLQLGDVILRVNDESVEGLSHAETVSLLRMAPSLVKLYICRPDVTILSPLPDSVANTASHFSVKSQVPGASSRADSADTATLTSTNANHSESHDQKPDNVTSYSPVLSTTKGTRSPLSVESGTTLDLQESITSSDTAQTVLKTSAVLEFESKLRARKAGDYSLPTPIRELDDMLQANTSTHTSRSHSPRSLSRASSMSKTSHLMIAADEHFDIDIISNHVERQANNTGVSSDSETTDSSESSDSRSAQESPVNQSDTKDLDIQPAELYEGAADSFEISPANTTSVKALAKVYEHQTELSNSPVKELKVHENEINSENNVQTVESYLHTPDTVPPVVSNTVGSRPLQSDVNEKKTQDSSIPSNTLSFNSLPSEQIVKVTLEKDSYGSLGFSVAGSASLGGCYIKKIIKDPALSNGELRAGDRLLEVNGHSIIKLTNPAAVALIKNQPSTVTITVLRPLDSTEEVPTKPPRTDTAILSTEKRDTGSVSSSSQQSGVEALTLKQQEPDVRTDVNISAAELAKSEVEKAGDAELADSVIHAEVDQPNTSASNDPFDKAEHKSRTESLAENEDEDNFSSVEGEVPDDIDDSWSSDTVSEDEESQLKEMLVESHIGTLSLNSTLDTLDTSDNEPAEDILPESRIGTPSQESSDGETQDEDAVDSAPEIDLPTNISHEKSQSPWSNTTADSDADNNMRRNSLTPIDLRRNDSGRSVTFGTDNERSTSPDGLSRNPSTRDYSTGTQLSRHDSSHSYQSFLSTPILSRSGSLRLPPTEEVYKVSLVKPTAATNLGITVLGTQVDDTLFACVKSLNKNGLAYLDGNIKVGHKILQINGEEVTGTSESDIQAHCVNLIKESEGSVNIVLSRGTNESHSDDFVLTQEEDDIELSDGDDQLGELGDEKLLRGPVPRRIFGPSVTTTDEDTDADGTDDFSLVIKQLSNDLRDTEYTDSEVSVTDTVTEDSSVDFDLPDESQFLEASIRLTRKDINFAQSDDLNDNSSSDTDYVISDDDIVPNSTKYNTDDLHAHDTDSDFHMKNIDALGDWDTSGRSDRNYDSSALPGATSDLHDREETVSVKHAHTTPTSDNLGPMLLDKQGDEKSIELRRRNLQTSKKGFKQIPVRETSLEHSGLEQLSGTEGKHLDKQESGNDTSDCDITAAPTSFHQTEQAPNSSVTQDLFSLNLTMSWIKSLTLVTTPARSLYNDSSLEGIITLIRNKITNDDVYEEFRQLKSLKPTDNCEAGKLKENKAKNRFRNVLPYDSTRVKLNSKDDYINASFIEKQLGKKIHKYIACQGPTPQTAASFWQMIIEQGITVVAMATQDVEGGKVKCHRYWPDAPHTTLTVGGSSEGYEVTLVRVVELQDFDIRQLLVKEVSSGRVHEVRHMNYTRWPDHVVPESATPLLQFIRVMHELYNRSEPGAEKLCPILVHCSAGIGRTGTLITLDLVLASIEKDLKFNIHQIVTELRAQRPGMIQTKDQYLFCYTAALEALETLKKVPSL